MRSSGLIAVLLIIAVLFVAPGASRATDTWTLSIEAFNGTLYWDGSGPNRFLVGSSFSFSEIVGYDENGAWTKTFTLPAGHAGIVSFTTDPGYTYTFTPASRGTGTVNTMFPGGFVTMKDTYGATSTTLVNGSFDADGVTATSVWNKLPSGKYNSANVLIGGFSAATLSTTLTSFFNIASEASGSLNLNRWSIFGAASATPEALLLGSTSGGLLTVQDTPVPLPAAVFLLAPGLFGLVVVRRRMRG